MLAERVKDVDQYLQEWESTFNFLLERGVRSESENTIWQHC